MGKYIILSDSFKNRIENMINNHSDKYDLVNISASAAQLGGMIYVAALKLKEVDNA